MALILDRLPIAKGLRHINAPYFKSLPFVYNHINYDPTASILTAFGSLET